MRHNIKQAGKVNKVYAKQIRQGLPFNCFLVIFEKPQLKTAQNRQKTVSRNKKLSLGTNLLKFLQKNVYNDKNKKQGGFYNNEKTFRKNGN